jgi:hypothetical protein
MFSWFVRGNLNFIRIRYHEKWILYVFVDITYPDIISRKRLTNPNSYYCTF